MHPLIAVPAIIALVSRAWLHKSLTPGGIAAAALTATVHAVHPWSVFFALLVVFYLLGTRVTKVKHDAKARMTLSSSGASGGEGSRTHVQVLANSIVASGLVLAHAYLLRFRSGEACWSSRGAGVDLLPVGIVANYAAVAADTFSSELGILSKSPPRLITSWNLKTVPRGTNGGVSSLGLVAGFAGAASIAVTSVLLLPFCADWTLRAKTAWVLAITIWGGLGSLVDSFLGGWLQASVVDTRTGKVVEGDGGRRVLVSETLSSASGRASAGQTRQRKQASEPESKPSRTVETGRAVLDNNGVNFAMAAVMSFGAMALARYIG